MEKLSQQVDQMTSSEHTNVSTLAATAAITSSYCSIVDNTKVLVSSGSAVVSVFVAGELLLQPRFESSHILEEAASSCRHIWSALMSAGGTALISKTMLELQRLLINPTIKLSYVNP